MKCVEFHPSAQVALTAGMDSTLSLFQVNRNPISLMNKIKSSHK